MAVSVVGYEYDQYNKVPKYCSRCKRVLKGTSPVTKYNVYTGEPEDVTYLTCPTLNNLHDTWKLEGYGVWVNYKHDG